MTGKERWGWGLVALAVALLLLFLSRSSGAVEADFMPKGGRALLLQVLGAPGDLAQLQATVAAKRTEAEWKAELASRKDLNERERATLAAYLAGNMPLAADMAGRADVAKFLPADGRDLAWNECQSCHSLFTSYLTQSRDYQGWRNVFLSPFHRQLAFTSQQRDEFARYAAVNMPMKADDVPQELRY
jgi:hypothetical protein